ncbi:SGNH/GDSL hydrolase family protein [Aquimarina sp. TRL1]|uniref:SGNH/GDSL hydrolase family protein n=1 Tax=Aquimarina sp. (strain TRL1) TaxID=2736252 RepID=UPI001588E803|nr:SGNH/GDSL hydrolase family protein [Aquimarina sp. TRL1]QKX06647.1 SGNH/GDSL hydrolase family protein [Aquimarina sp. TRL1]
MQKLFFLFVAVVLSTHSNIYGQSENHNATSSYTILFIGNSLTYTNNLPQLVKKYGKQKGIRIKTKMVAYPNYSIEDHWNDKQIQRLIANRKYNFVIIQQGPSSRSNGRKMLIDYGKKYKTLCDTNESKLCYFTVWPSLTYYHTFEAVIENYKEGATTNNSILLPVGAVWKAYIDDTKRREYYGPDGFHPSLRGSKIAAKVIVDTLFPQ